MVGSSITGDNVPPCLQSGIDMSARLLSMITATIVAGGQQVFA